MEMEKRQERRTIAVLALCTLLPSLGAGIATVALPGIAVAFEASFGQVQWVVLAYLLASTAVMVTVGRLGDVLGRRRLLVAGAVVFAVASFACAVAPGLPWLLAGRVLQGAGAAALTVLSIAAVGDRVPKARAGRAMGLLASMFATGTALGPALGGLLVAWAGWAAVFAVLVPGGAAAAWFVARVLPDDTPQADVPRPRFDVAGAVGLASVLVVAALALSGGRGRPHEVTLVLFGVAAAGLVLFVRHQARVDAPLLSGRVLRVPGRRTALVAVAAVSAVMMSTLVVGPFHLARALGLPAAAVGLAMSVGPVVAALAGAPAGRLVDRFGAPAMVRWGIAGIGAGCTGLALAPAAWGVAGYLVPLAVATAHYALFQAGNLAGLMADVTADERGAVSGLTGLARQSGFLVGASGLGAVFAVASGAGDVAVAAAGEVARGTHVTFAVGAAAMAVLAVVVVRPWRARGSSPVRTAPSR